MHALSFRDRLEWIILGLSLAVGVIYAAYWLATWPGDLIFLTSFIIFLVGLWIAYKTVIVPPKKSLRKWLEPGFHGCDQQILRPEPDGIEVYDLKGNPIGILREDGHSWAMEVDEDMEPMSFIALWRTHRRKPKGLR